MLNLPDEAAAAIRAHHVQLNKDLRTRVAATGASAILALFESHLSKENHLLIPALVANPDVSLADVLSGMHELVG